MSAARPAAGMPLEQGSCEKYIGTAHLWPCSASYDVLSNTAFELPAVCPFLGAQKCQWGHFISLCRMCACMHLLLGCSGSARLWRGLIFSLSVAYKASLTFSGLCALAGELFSKRFSCRPDLRRQFWRDRAFICGAPRAALVRAAQALNSTGEVLRDIYFVAGDSICG